MCRSAQSRHEKNRPPCWMNDFFYFCLAQAPRGAFVFSTFLMLFLLAYEVEDNQVRLLLNRYLTC
jgi:hypothetical protein